MTTSLRADREITADTARPAYDVIVCGAGTAGSVIARRLSDDPAVRVLLVEAGGSDRVPSVQDTTLWMSNIGSERDWCFRAEPSPHLNGRTPPLPMGKLLGGGSSINGSVWARGHKNDFDGWAEAVGDPAWNYAAALDVYRRIEAFEGPHDPTRRGYDGILPIVQPQDPVPLVPALIASAARLGIPPVDDINAEAMEGRGGCGVPNVLVGEGNRRVSMAAAYLHDAMTRPNLDIVLCTEVAGLLFEGGRASGVRLVQRGRTFDVRAEREVVLSMGAINTPKLLMLSGIGDEAELARHGIPVRSKLRGVGRNFQDHILLAGCCFEYVTPEPPRNNAAEFVFFAASRSDIATPDLMPVLEEIPFGSEVTGPQYGLPSDPASAWTLAPGLAHPASRGRVHLRSANPADAPRIEANFLAEPEDMRAMRYCVELCREIALGGEVAPFVARELMPGPLKGDDLDDFIRNAAGTYFHESCTAKMGRDEDAVVDASLRVYGVEGLRVADASVMPEITTGNTMAPTVYIAERAAEIIASAHGFARAV